MKPKRILILIVVFLLLAVLGYFQFRTWKGFRWDIFLSVTRQVQVHWILIAIALIYFTYYLRALRWKLFLKPICHTSPERLTAPTMIGFTGLALLGRPGELLRPYLIGRREGLTFSSQMGVWAVERIFDIAAFTIIAVPTIFLWDNHLPRTIIHEVRILRHTFTFNSVHLAAYFLMGAVLALVLGAVLLHKVAGNAGDWVRHKLRGIAPNFGRKICHKLNLFQDGLNTIHDKRTLLQLVSVSLVIWVVILFSYSCVIHAYYPIHISAPPSAEMLQEMRTEPPHHRQEHPLDLRTIQFAEIPLLTLASMAGSVIQLPAVGGGSQLATISTFRYVFNIDENLAVSCGIMLWLVTFFAVVPMGLVLSHREHVSLRKMSEESEQEEQQEESAPQPATQS